MAEGARPAIRNGSWARAAASTAGPTERALRQKRSFDHNGLASDQDAHGTRRFGRASTRRVPHEPHALKSRFARVGAPPIRPLFQDDRIMLYQSDITQFINQLKQQKPTLEEEQRRGRALLWDKQPIDLEERATQQQTRVKQNPYVYYQNF
jgi:hypothetical protein